MAGNGPQVAEGGYSLRHEKSTYMAKKSSTSKKANTGRFQQPAVSRRVIAIITASKQAFDRHVAKAERMDDHDVFVWVSKPQDAKGRTFDDYGHIYPWVAGDECEREVMSSLRSSRGG
jgi:hypothetical protein